jgi:peptidoglycan/LPS O-acetylase OafA/YrhL
MVQFLFIDCLMIALKWGLKLPINDNVRLGTADPGISLWAGDALMIATIAAVVLVSAMTYRWIEAPCRAFGRRLAPTGHSGPSRGMVGGALNASNP